MRVRRREAGAGRSAELSTSAPRRHHRLARRRRDECADRARLRAAHSSSRASLGAACPRSQQTLGIVQAMLVSSACSSTRVLIAFNLLPIPPLDGSHVIKYLLPRPLACRYVQFGRFGFLVLIMLLRVRRARARRLDDAAVASATDGAARGGRVVHAADDRPVAAMTETAAVRRHSPETDARRRRSSSSSRSSPDRSICCSR